MSKLLYFQASPRGPRSKSVTVADEFVKAYRQTHPDDQVETLNLFQANLIPFDGLAVQAKYTILHGKEHSQAEADAWQAVEQTIAQFTSADKYVLAVPMWNFSIPYRLKQYIDILVQPGYTFSFSPEEGYKGLVVGKPVFLAYARGGEYSEAASAPLNYQSTYLETIFGFMGFTSISSVTAEPTLTGGPDVADKVLSQAVEKAQTLARNF